MNKLYNNGNVIHSDDTECLYLLVEDSNQVCINSFLLEQHQIDGLRVLFKLFKKKSPGVVVNFPPSCGKSTTVASFLNAVADALKNPVLVICKDSNEIQYWKRILLKWSSYVDEDIAVESLNPFIKGRKVFLVTRENRTPYLRRQWSVIVIKEDMDLFKLKLEADFKIFITSTDVKKDLSLFSNIYMWLYPKRKVNINDFVAKENRPKERFKKSVQLDFLLEDVAIRRYINLQPFQTNKEADNVRQKQTIVKDVEYQRKTDDRIKRIKNKDATGTKVKRSRRVITDDYVILNTTTGQHVVSANDQIVQETLDQNEIDINSHTNEKCDNDGNSVRSFFIADYDREKSDGVQKDYENKHKSPTVKENRNFSTNNDHDTGELDVESFIRNEKPLRSIDTFPPNKSHLFEKEETNNENSKLDISEIKDLVDKVSLQKQLIDSLNLDQSTIDLDETQVNDESTESLNFEDDSNGDLNKNKDLDKKSIKGKLTESINSENNGKKIKDSRNQLIESLDFDSSCTKKSQLKNSEVNLNETKDLSNKQKELIDSLGFDSESLINEYKSKGDPNEITDLEKYLKKEDSSLSVDNDSKVDLNKKKDLHNKNVLKKQLIESLGFDDDDDVKLELKNKFSDDQSGFGESLLNEANKCDLKENEIVITKAEKHGGDETNAEKNENIVANKRKSDQNDEDLDHKISLLEEKALKKFKGSLLDSIF